MTLSIRGLFIVIFTASLQCYAFLQGEDTPNSLYVTGVSVITKNPEKAFQFLERAMNSARQEKDWALYKKALNKLASMDFNETEEKEEKVFTWLKESVALLENATEDSSLAQLHYNTANFYFKRTNQIDPPVFHYQKAKKNLDLLKRRMVRGSRRLLSWIGRRIQIL